MIDPTEVERYRLTPAENRQIFHEEIVPELLERRVPQEKPTVVFLVGQPGSGKSRVTRMVANVLDQQGGFVDVDSDLYKPYHPAYDALMAQDDTLMAAYTRADGRAWMAQAEEYVRAHKLHAVVQETSQDASAVESKMLAYRRAGARVEALFMGVPQAMSNQGIISRYFEQVADRGQGRLTVQANADESYRGILELAEGIDDGVLADLVSVYRRGESKPRYSNTVAGDDWNGPLSLRQALETERNRPWTAAESEAFVATQQQLREAISGLGPEWPMRLTRIEQQAAPLLTPSAAQQLPPPQPGEVAATNATAAAFPSESSGPPAPGVPPDDLVSTAGERSRQAAAGNDANRAAAPAAYATVAAARQAGEEVARSFQAWVQSDMGRELAASPHPRISALREAWRQLPPHDLPHGPGSAAAPYRAVAERAHAAVTAAVAENRFAPGDVKALLAVALAAGAHSARLTATQPGAAAAGRQAAQRVAAPAPRAVTPPPDAPRSPGLGA
ncbi:zeta toxin family protein [Streptomyces sp. NPDC048603]|uniref:zeta toxin family protein n=1 Tax=Streptomyces sp. NPDC048603 TaxID=3365577 RepID=UPI00371F5FBD